jgi:hypothetical protein
MSGSTPGRLQSISWGCGVTVTRQGATQETPGAIPGHLHFALMGAWCKATQVTHNLSDVQFDSGLPPFFMHGDVA